MHGNACLPAQMDVHRRLPMLAWKLIYMQTYIHMQCTHAYILHPCIWVQCTHMCICKFAHVCECMYIAWMSVDVWTLTFLCLCKCMFVCILIPHPVFWESSPWLRGRLRIKSQGLRRKGWGMPQRPEIQTSPSFFWEECPQVTQKIRWLTRPCIPHFLCVPLCSPPKEVLQRVRQSPQRQKDWGKGWRGNLQECPNGKATLNRMFS